MNALIRHAMVNLLPATARLPGVADTGVDAFLARLRRESNGLFRAGLILGALVFAFTPLFTIGVPLPSFLLWRSARARHARKIASHPVYLVRQAVFMVKVAAGLCWGADPRVRDALALPRYGADPATWRGQ